MKNHLALIFCFVTISTTIKPDNFLMTASRGEIVQAYLAQCEEKKMLHQELHRVLERNHKLEHDHFSLKAEYALKGMISGVLASAVGFLIYKVFNK